MKIKMKQPFFTISLDFELFWGVYDLPHSGRYKANVIGGRKAIPLLLNLFKKYGIHVTWATVGMISFEKKKDLINYLPDIYPNYKNKALDPYGHIENIGENENQDPLHFGYSLVQKILEFEGMEIGNHSFSHFYCLEEDNSHAFRSDLDASKSAFERLGINTTAYVFCKNQYNADSLRIIKERGFKCFRGNENSWIYDSRPNKQSSYLRSIRYLDNYINFSGYHPSRPSFLKKGMLNIPSSRFLRPVSKVKYPEHLRLKRIKDAMLFSAQTGNGFHLWWHPHNFGQNLEGNIEMLSKILKYFKILNDKYDMQSFNMSEVNIIHGNL